MISNQFDDMIMLTDGGIWDKNIFWMSVYESFWQQND